MKKKRQRSCGKVRYRDRIAALMALASTQSRRGSERRTKDERRAYRCPDCKGWHLTSRARPPGHVGAAPSVGP